MDILRRCNEIWGADTLIENDPAEEVCFGAVYNPFRRELWLSDPEWGVYDTDGRLIDAAAYYRLPQKFRVGQSAAIALADRAITTAPEGDYTYVGPVILHYGHFITAFLPRLWQAVRSGLSPTMRFVCHSDHHPDDWFARDYVRCLLGALGLGPERFVRPQTATRFRRLQVPRPALEEQNFAHRVMRELGLHIGSRLTFDRSRRVGPIYVSKTLVRDGTYRIGNEAEMDDIAAARGLTVLRPERLSFLHQIEVLSASPLICGTLTSAFHTALFCAPSRRIIGLAYENRVNANYPLIDKLTGADATYVYPSAGLMPKPLINVTFGYWLENARSVMDEIIGLI